MKRTLMILALASASSAFAQEAVQQNFDQYVGGKSRAEVHAAAIAAMKLGQIQYGEAGPAIYVASDSAKTREQVKAELAAARARGERDYGEAEQFAVTPVQGGMSVQRH